MLNLLQEVRPQFEPILVTVERSFEQTFALVGIFVSKLVAVLFSEVRSDDLFFVSFHHLLRNTFVKLQIGVAQLLVVRLCCFQLFLLAMLSMRQFSPLWSLWH